jgi:hypothetical protein
VGWAFVNNFIDCSPMIAQRVPLSKLHIVDELPSPLKRKAKIFASKLPQDFFARRTPL